MSRDVGCSPPCPARFSATGVETIITYVRDRNLMASKRPSRCARPGLRNSGTVSATRPAWANYKTSTGRVDVESSTHSSNRRMNDGFDTARNSNRQTGALYHRGALIRAPKIFPGTGPFVKKPSRAEFIMTQPLWDIEALWDCGPHRQRDLNVPIVFEYCRCIPAGRPSSLQERGAGHAVPDPCAAISAKPRQAWTTVSPGAGPAVSVPQTLCGVYLMPSLQLQSPAKSERLPENRERKTMPKSLRTTDNTTPNPRK